MIGELKTLEIVFPVKRKTDLKQTWKRLRNCYTCPFRDDRSKVHCSSCPPLSVMKFGNKIFDQWFEIIHDARFSDDGRKGNIDKVVVQYRIKVQLKNGQSGK